MEWIYGANIKCWGLLFSFSLFNPSTYVNTKCSRSLWIDSFNNTMGKEDEVKMLNLNENFIRNHFHLLLELLESKCLDFSDYPSIFRISCYSLLYSTARIRKFHWFWSFNLNQQLFYRTQPPEWGFGNLIERIPKRKLKQIR